MAAEGSGPYAAPMSTHGAQTLPPATDLISAAELLQLLIERPSLRQQALTCVLPAIRMNDQWHYRRSDLNAWLISQRQEPLP